MADKIRSRRGEGEGWKTGRRGMEDGQERDGRRAGEGWKTGRRRTRFESLLQVHYASTEHIPKAGDDSGVFLKYTDQVGRRDRGWFDGGWIVTRIGALLGSYQFVISTRLHSVRVTTLA